VAYAASDSALLGGIPASDTATMQKYFDDAADEMDATLGFLYETPITKTHEGGSLPRPVVLILARINRFLASGRYIMAVASAGEDGQVNAYGYSLVKEAQTALNSIAQGEVELDAVRLPNPGSSRRTPRVANAEDESNVDAFYDAFTGFWPSQKKGMIFDPNFPKNIGQREAEWIRGW
jgi:hypothetical protein